MAKIILKESLKTDCVQEIDRVKYYLDFLRLQPNTMEGDKDSVLPTYENEILLKNCLMCLEEAKISINHLLNLVQKYASTQSEKDTGNE